MKELGPQSNNYTCVVPFSGGVESTALVKYLVKRKEKPFCFHVLSVPGESKCLHLKEKLFGVKIVTVRINMNWDNGWVIDKGPTIDFWKKNFNKSGYPPNQQLWAAVAFQFIINNPYIHNIYFGHNGGSLLESGDNLGDSSHTDGEYQYVGYRDAANELNIPLRYSAPLDRSTKLEQYQSLSEEEKQSVFVCERDTTIHCLECKKCKELLTVAKADGTEHYFK